MFSGGGSRWLVFPGGLRVALFTPDDEATAVVAESNSPSSEVIMERGVDRPPSDLVATWKEKQTGSEIKNT